MAFDKAQEHIGLQIELVNVNRPAHGIQTKSSHLDVHGFLGFDGFLKNVQGLVDRFAGIIHTLEGHIKIQGVAVQFIKIGFHIGHLRRVCAGRGHG